MKNLFFLGIILAILPATAQTNADKLAVQITLNRWHQAAAAADFDTYFGLMTEDAIFIGTDATENWPLKEFKAFSKPYFDRGKAWSFTALERNIYFDKECSIAWFDELLKTQMGICRGSGVMSKTTEGWKVQHYVLSIAIPNENVDTITALKKQFDENLIEVLTIKQN